MQQKKNRLQVITIDKELTPWSVKMPKKKFKPKHFGKKLEPHEVSMIRDLLLFHQGEIGQRAIAREFGVSQVTISHINTNTTWCDGISNTLL